MSHTFNRLGVCEEPNTFFEFNNGPDIVAVFTAKKGNWWYAGYKILSLDCNYDSPVSYKIGYRHTTEIQAAIPALMVVSGRLSRNKALKAEASAVKAKLLQVWQNIGFYHDKNGQYELFPILKTERENG